MLDIAQTVQRNIATLRIMCGTKAFN